MQGVLCMQLKTFQQSNGFLAIANLQYNNTGEFEGRKDLYTMWRGRNKKIDKC